MKYRKETEIAYKRMLYHLNEASITTENVEIDVLIRHFELFFEIPFGENMLNSF